MSLEFTSEKSAEDIDVMDSSNHTIFESSVNRRVITTLNPETYQFLQIPEIWEFDNHRVDKIIEQYDLETLLRFPWILIECFLNKDMNKKYLRRFNCQFKDGDSHFWYESNDRYRWKVSESSELHLDWIENIILYYETTPIANIGLDDNLISQIQQAKITCICSWGNIVLNTFIQWFNWKKVLVKIAEKYLRQREITQIYLDSANKSYWKEVRSNSSVNQWWYEIYDKTALDLWYEFDWNWRYLKNL